MERNNKKRFDLTSVALVVSDFIAYILSFFFAYFFRISFFPNQIQPLRIYLKALPIVVALLLIVFYTFSLYQDKIRITKISEIYTITKANAFVLILIMAASFLNKYDYSRALVLIFWAFSTIILNCGRIIIHYIQRKLVKKGIGLTKILVVGSGHQATQLKRSLKRFRTLGYQIVTAIPRSEIKTIPKILSQKSINEVYFADPSTPHELILSTIAACENTPARFKIISGLFDVLSPHVDLYNLEGIPAIDLHKSNPSLSYYFFKRIFDIFASVLGLIVLSPIFLIITIAIHLDSKGSAIFTHKRAGKNGKQFLMHKFRTMQKESKQQDYAPSTPNDPRITKVGRFLRRTSLDELPQLYNVLKGQMSIVGTRPEMPFIVAKYNSWQRQRLKEKPGITGLWQILGRKDLPLHENLEYDLYYINNQSFFLDMVIVLKTVFIVVQGKGAY